MSERIRPVLFFDSGIGGLSVLREARIVMPDRHFIYVADDAGFPYGTWDEDALRERILILFEWLIRRYDPELCIVACNTASTLVLADLRRHFSSVPFVGTVPAIKPAAEQTLSGIISVLATPGTVKRAYTRDLIASFAQQCQVRLVGSESLAMIAEGYLRGMDIDYELVRREIAGCFIEKSNGRTDIVVLACTHYPFLINVFRKVAHWPVDWLDPAEAISRRAASLLTPLSEQMAPSADLAFFTSQTSDFATRRLLHGFGLQCDW